MTSTRAGAAGGRASERIELGGATLHVRPGVAVREGTSRGSAMFYLSLLDDEIDERIGHFAAATSTSELEPTDAVVMRQPGGRIVALRGSSCTLPIFWGREGDTLRLSTALPIHEDPRFSREGIVAGMAAVCVAGSYEPNAWTQTPLRAWQRVRRGTATTFEPPAWSVEERPLEPTPRTGPELDEETVTAQVRSAFEAYGHSQRHVTASVLELSGGFDSTLAGAAALRASHAMHGISVEFPYYEFRFESEVQEAVARALSLERHPVDGTQLFPFAPWKETPRTDEPSVFVTGIRHAEHVAELAAARGASRIYVGHGGDQLFSTDLLEAETVTLRLARGLFDRSAWRGIGRAVARMREPRWSRRDTGCFVYDARQDVWAKETFGVTLRTPFTDLAVLRAAVQWSRWSAARGARPDKTILARGLPEWLPDAVTGRRGKVAYDGVWMRAYPVHADHIARTLERASAVLEHVGMSPAWLQRRVRALAEWKAVSDREVLGAYAVSAWLTSWGIERPSDVAWE